MNAILYINKTGCQWRALPREFGQWKTVYYHFRKWKMDGVFEDLLRPDECSAKFPVLPKQWIVQRSFALLKNFMHLPSNMSFWQTWPRLSYDLQNSEKNNSQRMLKALEPGTVMPIHRCHETSETVVMLKGSLDWVFYDDGAR